MTRASHLFILLSILGCAFAAAGTAHADDAYFKLPDSDYLEMTPASPQPGSQVKVELKTTDQNVRISPITWYVDGKVAATGSGLTIFTTTAGASGTATLIEAVVDKNGVQSSYSVTIRPAVVQLVWEADTYVPPFYRGRALPVADSDIRIVAMPRVLDDNGKIIPSDQLLFSWSIGGKPVLAESGLGRNVLHTSMSRLGDDLSVYIKVSVPSQPYQAETGLIISPYQPQTLLYEDQPLLGIRFDRAIGSFSSFVGNEFKILAFPFFFSSDRSASALSYLWHVGYDKADTGNDPATLVLHTTGTGKGSQTIKVDISDGVRILQRANATTQINFQNNQ